MNKLEPLSDAITLWFYFEVPEEVSTNTSASLSVDVTVPSTESVEHYEDATIASFTVR